MTAPLAQRLGAEALGTAFLLATVVGSGIMAQKLAGGNVALALLGNTLPTGAMLVVLILIFGPLSGAHFNPAVSLAFAVRGELPWRIAVAYIAVQFIGAVIGVISAYYGGKIDLLIQGIMDILLSFPIIVLALVVVAMLGQKIVLGVDVNLIVAIGIPMVPRVARVVRASALAIRELPYIDAARAAGFSDARIIFRHMVPNVVAPYLIMLTAYVAQAILSEASLSFLGLGVTEPTASWGLMLSGSAADFYQQAPWMIVFPGLAISLAVFAFNLFGDSLRDWLDPKIKI